MTVSHEVAVKKAAVAVSQLSAEGGYMLPEQMDSFLQVAVPPTSILSQIPIIVMSRPERHIEKFRFATRVLRAGSTQTALDDTERALPQFSKQVLKSHLFKAEINVPKETVEDNIEKDNFIPSLLRAIAPRVGLDIEEVGINGDVNNAVDPFLAQFDGILKQASLYQYDHQGDTVNPDLWHKMIKLMPVEFQGMLPGMSFFSPYNLQHDWRHWMTGRVGPVGDAALQSLNRLKASGLDVVPVANMREDDVYNGSANHGKVMLLHPSNVAFGLRSGIEVTMDYDTRQGVWIVVLTLRMDWKLIERTAVVRGENILLGSTNSNVGGSSTAQLVAHNPTALNRLGYTIIDTAIGNDDGLSTFVPPTGSDLGITAPSFYP